MKPSALKKDYAIGISNGKAYLITKPDYKNKTGLVCGGVDKVDGSIFQYEFGFLGHHICSFEQVLPFSE